jgi:proliferating cell nuclear antigen
MFWKAVHRNPIKLYKLIKTISSIIENFSINIENDGLSILQMDSAHICVLDIFIDKSDFSEYTFTKKQNIIVNSNNLCKALSLSEKIDSITLSLKNKDSNKLNILFNNESRKSKMSLHLIEFDNSKISIPCIDYNIELEMTIGRFIKICKNLSQFGSNIIKFKSDTYNQTIYIYGEGDIGNIEIMLKETNKIIKKRVNIKKKTNDGFELETKNITGHKEIVINNFVKNIMNTFSLEYVNKILNMSLLSNRVNIGLSHEMPMEIGFQFFENSYLNYYIAPKIENN